MGSGGYAERSLGRRGRHDKISEREERVGQQAHECQRRQRGGQGWPGPEETDVRRSKLEMRKNSGLVDLVLSIRSKSNGQDLLWAGTPSPPTHTFISSIENFKFFTK
jgi:hypothetical protein